MTHTNDKIWLSRVELAERLGIPAKTPAEWACKKIGPRYARFGKHVRYRLADVLEWEDSVMSAPPATITAD
ncbi:helix-turn-helix transcriptional regulator [Mycobacterium hackensackense]|uniref:helix-turn-helix transcriptional regulator n=1 Tax=Mycobacterium hackensackense TaxID=228909 RepID=UPI0027E275DE|nr:helix-turn-helix domain-containing protein [Mycobacterium hackensackense]